MIFSSAKTFQPRYLKVFEKQQLGVNSDLPNLIILQGGGTVGLDFMGAYDDVPNTVISTPKSIKTTLSNKNNIIFKYQNTFHLTYQLPDF
ncbi:hypothetical protein TNCT_255131 [Trichonephila clavata]|uniref:Uncharacterized protein n=1 Tax=Trichonephila clavata TaxID=2740835 RepID=A0A8X6GN05_TRICU|nr:hypothetical protein TNCT_255131 [Trichonephila clavata]